MLSIVPVNISGARIVDSNPEDGAEDVPIDVWITLRFNTTMDPATVNIKITPSLEPYGYRQEWGDNERELVIKPNSALAYSEEYEIQIISGEDTDGNPITDDTSIKFNTEASPGILGIFSEMIDTLWSGFLAIFPSLVLLIFIFLIGYIISKTAGWIFSQALKKLGFDRAMENVGVAKQLRSIGIKSPSKFLGIFVFWFIFVIVIQIAISAMGVPAITNILAPIILFIPRILIAAIVLLIGLYVANVIVQKLMDRLSKTEIGKQLHVVDKKVKTSGFSIISVFSMFIKIFILLFFLQVALEIVNIGLLSEFITPVLLIMPLILLALFIVLVGLLVTEIVRKAILKLIKEFKIMALIKPVEQTIGRRGVILNVFIFVIRIIVMLVFIQLAISILNSTGAFNQLAQLINLVILWMPNVLAALVIILIGFWFAGWTSKKVLESRKAIEVPFPKVTATVVKYLIIYLAGVMAIAQLGFEVPILYIVTAIVLGAVFIGLGAGLAMGTKEIFANIGGYIQTNKILEVGNHVTIDSKYKGKISNIGHYTTTLTGDDGKKIIIPNSQLVKSVIIES
jgi:small-conductance mechanosensitive channel